jgi:hypothetical protein
VNTWKVIVATIVIFGAGVVTGGLLVRHAERLDVRLARRPPVGPRPGVLANPAGQRLEFLRRAERDLDLTPDQRAQIDHVLKESQERTRRLMEPVAPGLRMEFQRAKDEFRAVLMPGQRVRFDELMKHQHRPGPDRLPQGAVPTNTP